MRHPLASLAIIVILGFSTAAHSDEAAISGDPGDLGPSAARKTFDLLVLRPADAFSVVFGGILLVPAALASAPGGTESIDNAYDVFLRTPWENLTQRPLGLWDQY